MFAETSARAVKCSVHLNRGLVVWLCGMAEHKNWEEVYQCNQVRSTIYTFSVLRMSLEMPQPVLLVQRLDEPVGQMPPARTDIY